MKMKKKLIEMPGLRKLERFLMLIAEKFIMIRKI